MRTLIVGPGWLGSKLAESMATDGARVWAMHRGAASAPTSPFVTSVRGDVTAWATERSVHAPTALLSGALPESPPAMPSDLPPEFPDAVDAVVLCVAPSRSRGDTHESTYPAAARGAVRLADALGARVLLHVSSTGVYARTDGAVVTEATPVVRDDARQRALADAEDLVWNEPASRVIGRVVLRVAGLYGPERDPAKRFADPALLGPDGDYWCNFAWRDDVVSAIRHLLPMASHARDAHCYNCADGAPLRAREIASRVLDARPASTATPTTTAVPMAMSMATATPGVATGVIVPPSPARARSNQRVDVSRLLATGWTPSMPDVFAGLAALGHSLPPAP